ncbi:hypothetical protein [Candidiatus Paracoxiella cheracis]|uniref:hypothetical protein n=1 Tax=Candidiatus Paracoxiella cheracis TaxID=3405120 RepID=UPI003BF4F280
MENTADKITMSPESLNAFFFENLVEIRELPQKLDKAIEDLSKLVEIDNDPSPVCLKGVHSILRPFITVLHSSTKCEDDRIPAALRSDYKKIYAPVRSLYDECMNNIVHTDPQDLQKNISLACFADLRAIKKIEESTEKLDAERTAVILNNINTALLAIKEKLPSCIENMNKASYERKKCFNSKQSIFNFKKQRKNLVIEDGNTAPILSKYNPLGGGCKLDFG